MKILVCGDRNWTDQKLIYDKLRWLPPFSIVVSGACRGADKLSTKAANLLELVVIEYPADWNKYGKSAGVLRNIEMLKETPDEVWAFHDDIENSKGTKDMVSRAKRMGILVKIYKHE
jgi:hypothetical protein